MLTYTCVLLAILWLQCSGQVANYAGRNAIPVPSVPSATLPRDPFSQPHGPLPNFPTDGSNIPLDQLPQWVRDLEGNTITGNIMVGGFGGLPQHGGLGADADYSSGTREGWGHDRHSPMPTSLSSWVAPANLDREFLQRISTEFLRGPGIDSNVHSILERPRVDSFVLSPSAENLFPRINPVSGAMVPPVRRTNPRATGFIDVSPRGPLTAAGQFDIYGRRQVRPL